MTPDWFSELDRLGLDREPELPAFADLAESRPSITAPPAAKKRRRLSTGDAKRLTERLAQVLPASVRQDRNLTDVDLRVLAAIKIARTGPRASEATKERLARGAGCSVRQIALSRRVLERLGYVRVFERRVGREMNLPNIWELTDKCFSAETAKRRVSRARGAKGCVQSKPEGFSNLTSTVSRTPSGEGANTRSGERGCRERRFASGVRSKRPGLPDRSSPRPVPIPRLNGADPSEVSLAKRALLSLSQTCWHINAGPEDVDDFDGIVAFIEQLRTEKISRFSESWWPHCVRRHRFKAYLAVVEVLLMAEIKEIGSLSGYLGGILRRPPGDGDDCARPDITLQRTLESRGEWLDSHRRH